MLDEISSSTTLTITSAVLDSIVVTLDNPEIPLGRTIQFTAIGTYSNNTMAGLTNLVSWASSNKNIATIGATGLVQSLAEGQTTITATLGEKWGSTTLTVTGAVLDYLVITPDNPEIAKGNTMQFTATAHYSYGSPVDVTDNCTWHSYNTAIATIETVGQDNPGITRRRFRRKRTRL